MSVPEQQISVGDLQFSLYERPAHPELFRIEYRQDVKERSYWASIWLIDGGHAVSFYWKKHFLTELLRGVGGLGPRRGLLHKFLLRGERTCRHSCEAGLKYIMAGQVERMGRQVFADTYQDVLATAQSRGTLVLRGPAEDLKVPFVYVEIEARDTELHVSTCHAFPDELAMARTQSIFKAPSAPSPGRRITGKARRGHSSSK
ncbi:MAG: DUF2617 family protein [Actinobacteria bacterium]|nr:DUF2617 family protein [Actinomycetota bacterium]